MGKRKSQGVILFERNLEENIKKIQTDLLQETYRLPEYQVFKIYEPKERIIYRLPFYDRVVQHAIMNILEPIWTSLFISQSYACVKGRGIHGVVKRLKQELKDADNTKYCLKMDVRKFYPSIDHDIMKTIIRKKIKDVKLLSLLGHIIESAPGLPIGNYLSQFLSNLYLTYFDHWIKEHLRVKYYYRYADDLVILSGDKSYLHELRSEIEKYLRDELKLELKKNYQVFPIEVRGIDFVGYVFRQTHTRMRKFIKKNFCRKVAKLSNKKLDLKVYKQNICSWLGWAKYCDSKNLLNTVLAYEIN